MTRAGMYRRLRAHAGEWDIIVAGGGATGVGGATSGTKPAAGLAPAAKKVAAVKKKPAPKRPAPKHKR